MFTEVIWQAIHKKNKIKKIIMIKRMSGNDSDLPQLGTIVNRLFVSSGFLWRTGNVVIREKNTSLDPSFPAVLFDSTEVILGFISCVVCRKHPQCQAFMSPRSPESIRRCCLNTSIGQSASLDAWERYWPIIHLYSCPE